MTDVRNTFLEYALPKCTPDGEAIAAGPRIWSTEPTMPRAPTTPTGAAGKPKIWGTSMIVLPASLEEAEDAAALSEKEGVSAGETASTKDGESRGCSTNATSSDDEEEDQKPLEVPEDEPEVVVWKTDEVHLCDLLQALPPNLQAPPCAAPLPPPPLPPAPPMDMMWGASFFNAGAAAPSGPLPGLTPRPGEPCMLPPPHGVNMNSMSIMPAGFAPPVPAPPGPRQQEQFLEQRQMALEREMRQIEIERLELRQAGLRQEMRDLAFAKEQLQQQTPRPTAVSSFLPPPPPPGAPPGATPPVPRQGSAVVHRSNNPGPLPLDGVPNFGSLAHGSPEGCNPCAFLHKDAQGCQKGVDCPYCHICPPGELKRRKKEKVAKMKAAAEAAAAAALAAEA